MCGIAGYAGKLDSVGPVARRALASAMCTSLAHRGPDDADVWGSEDGRVVLGHRRLSVIDLSPLGRNPMPWDGGRLRITYNGEIYNYRELRRELEAIGCRFRSQTDTEVILAAYDRWGPDCLQRFIGMFAFAIWDEPRARLFLARDRLGKKPLYYSERNGGLAFASELKALAADPSFPRGIDPIAVSLYLQYGSVPPPFAIFAAARKLPPAHYALYESGRLDISQYWDPVAYAVAARAQVTDAEVDEQLEPLLRDAVERRMIADVPVGAFLSGGIDSSLVVALMQEIGTRPARTFTIRFDNPEFDESARAAAVARHLGTEHHEETCGVSEMLDIVDRLPEFFDEPFADSSAIPTYMVSRATRRHVTVALSGDGGDELFFGYPRYLFQARAGRLLDAPMPLRRSVAALAAAVPWRRVRRVADVLRDRSSDQYERFISWWDRQHVRDMTGTSPSHPAYARALGQLSSLPTEERAPVLDVVSYLPDDILTKVDRASMAVSLETRSPLLDHRVAEFALGLPLRSRRRGGTGKIPLRRLLEKRVPRVLFDRPKMGFGVPLADWLRGPLRARLDGYLRGDALPRLGVDPHSARALWREFLAGRSHRADRLWNLLALCSWAEHWKPEPAAREVHG